MRPGVWLAVMVCAVAASAESRGAATNTWQGKSVDWADGANWSAGAAPSGGSTQDVFIAGREDDVYPVLGADAAVGGSLILGERAKLSLNGHNLDVGGALPEPFDGATLMGSAAPTCGLMLSNGASLVSGPGPSTIAIHAGGLVNRGTVNGKPGLRIVGQTRGFRIDGGKMLELATLSTAPSPFPYPVVAEGRVKVAGDLELGGGQLTVRPAPSSFEVMGDLVFRGKDPPVMLVTEGDLVLHGTIRSEGSAFCVDVPGETPVWDKADNAGYCQTPGSAGWVCLVGDGDQTIVPGGILPALRIAKPSGVVKLSGDLHCTGLHVARGSALDLSGGQKLILGHLLREWAKNPELNGVPAFGPCRTSRDLVDEGRIVAPRGVPVEFRLNVKGARAAVACIYWPPERKGGADEGAMAEQLHKSQSWSAPGALAINRYNSRLRLMDGRLLLDGKPCREASAQPRADADSELLDVALDGIGSGPAGKPSVAARAAVTQVALRPIAGTFNPPAATPVNIAPRVARIVTPARTPTVFTANGPCWGRRDVYGSVDGDPAVGTGGATFYEFVFPEPVTLGGARLRSGSDITRACQFVLYGDGTTPGVCDRALAWGRDGEPANTNAWTAWGVSTATFEPQKVSRVRLQVFSAGGDIHGPAVDEIELFADPASADRLAGRPDAVKPETFPASLPFLERGATVDAVWPDPVPGSRACRVAVGAFWMAGVSWGAGIDEAAYDKMPPLRDHPPCAQFLSEVKDRYGFDAVTIFFEGESVGFPWPSTNFLSALNARYLNRREVALKLRRAAAPRKTGDAIEDVLEAEPVDSLGADGLKVDEPEGHFSEILKIEDLPCQRNLLREFCEAAHEKKLKVYLICRPEDMGKLYIGPPGRDAYEAFLKEGAAAGLDGVSLTPDEEYPLWQFGAHPRWKEFDASTREARKTFSLVERRRWTEARSRIAGECMQDRMEAIRQVNPDCEFYVDGAHLHAGDPYDVMWHVSSPDWVGCSYQSQLVPRWAATSKNRQVAMGEYPHRTVRFNLESFLLGARMIRTYRFNYIELAKSQDHRIRENLFMEQFARWGGTRPARAPTALLVSRASETWWPEDCRAGRVTGQSPDRCWMIEEILYEFMLKNGYAFDVYYLDQVEDLKALKDYRLVVLPFAYSVPRAALDRLTEAYAAGANFLVGERKGDVDEVGQAYGTPLLGDWIARGKQAGRIGVPEGDLVGMETMRDFVPRMSALLDPLLGRHKNLTLKRHGNRIEARAAAVAPDEHYAWFVNWEDRESTIEAGLDLPNGQYKVLTLTSAAPDAFREGLLAGQKTVSAEALRRFALKLAADEVLALHVVPEARTWGQWKD